MTDFERLETKIDTLSAQVATLRETIAAMRGYGLGVAAVVSVLVSIGTDLLGK